MDTIARVIVGTGVGYAIREGITSETWSSVPTRYCVHIGSGALISLIIRHHTGRRVYRGG